MPKISKEAIQGIYDHLYPQYVEHVDNVRQVDLGRIFSITLEHADDLWAEDSICSSLLATRKVVGAVSALVSLDTGVAYPEVMYKNANLDPIDLGAGGIG